MIGQRSIRRRAVQAAPCRLDRLGDRVALGHLIHNMDPWDRQEIMALRPAERRNDRALLEDIDAIQASDAHLEAWLFYPVGDHNASAVAYAAAWRVAPHLASLALFGARGCRRRLPGLIAWLAGARAHFARDHGISVGEVKVLARHPARRWIEGMGGEPVATLPGIGAGGEDFVQMIWRF